MTLTADARFVTRPVPRFAAGALALGVHGLFALLLVFGVSWQTEPPAPVMVDLWEALPAVQPPRPVPPPPPPEPEPPEPEAVKPPAPKPVVEEPQPKAPDIALEKKKAEAERLKATQEAEEKKQAEAARAEEAKKAREKQLAEQKKRELLRQMAEEDQMRVEEEARFARQAEAQSAAASKRQSEVASVVGQYRDMISAKVRGNTRLPANLTGNPEVRCLVMLLPTGEVKSVRVTKSSGNVAYDEAVVRAIEKSSPLPLPDDRDARAAFVPELSFVHRPK
ncbi:MAG: cell envelope integrity protein TolA [Thiobacillus sp.]|uniref:cell envelope integrity protein TolA n=1 Tax=Thiobacillus sp. TaxID=924 RepID=UPI0028941370|nr:cell envelope integrity protein TolA [Thiobacillus sp.]MDT3705461.1 cell envelope integrity protein TolA [Thiobacillus sp.]